jgi:hypothetical protein
MSSRAGANKAVGTTTNHFRELHILIFLDCF